jgi:hypothetical protein
VACGDEWIIQAWAAGGTLECVDSLWLGTTGGWVGLGIRW